MIYRIKNMMNISNSDTKKISIKYFFKKLIYFFLIGTTTIMITAYAESNNKHYFNIKTAPVSDALSKFAAQADSEILFLSDITTGKMSPNIYGTYTNIEVLNKLLSGTGLQAKETRYNIYLIQKSAP